MSELFFDTPWWLILSLTALGVAIFIFGNNRANELIKRIGLGILGVVVLLLLLSFFVDTDREKVLKGTHRLIDGVVKRDAAAIRSVMHPNVALGAWGYDDVPKGAIHYADMFSLRGVTIRSMDAEEHEGMITVTVSVLSQHEITLKMPLSTLPSVWQLDWFLTDKGWRLKNVTPLRIGTTEMEGSGVQYFNRKP